LHHLRHRSDHPDRSGAGHRRRPRTSPCLRAGARGTGAQSADLAAVPHLRGAGTKGRFRHLDPDRPAGDGGHRPRLPRHPGACHPGDHHRRAFRRAHGRGSRRETGSLAGPVGAGDRADRLFGADLLARPRGPADLLREARLGGRQRPPRLLSRRDRPDRHRAHPAGLCSGRRMGSLSQCASPHRAAGRPPRLFLARLHQPHDPQPDARAAEPGVRHDRQGEGRQRVAGCLGACPAQHPGAADHRDRPLLRQPARGLGIDRDRLRLAGPGALPDECASGRGHGCRPRRHLRRRPGLRRREPAERPPLSPRGPARPMSMPLQRPGWRAWLLSDRPQSALQARLGQAWLSWRAFRRNRLAMLGLGLILLLLVVAALAPWISPHEPNLQNLRLRLQPPGADHWLGTDELGRDILSRIIHGSRITLYIVTLVVVIAAPIGLLVGTVSGYFGGWVDAVLMRVTDIFLAFPRLILALAFVAALGPGIDNAVIAISITAWPTYARVARAETLTLRRSD